MVLAAESGPAWRDEDPGPATAQSVARVLSAERMIRWPRSPQIGKFSIKRLMSVMVYRVARNMFLLYSAAGTMPCLELPKN